MRDPIAYVDACVDRSVQWPLELIVDFSNYEILPESDAIQIWTKLCSQGLRWRRCHFVFKSHEVAWDSWPGTSPMLEELVAHTPLDCRSSVDVEIRIRLLPIAPNLTRLSFNSLHRPPATYGKLEYLSICLRLGPASLLWEVLSQTPFLREVKIFWSFAVQREEASPQRTISLPMLQRLEIYGHAASNFDSDEYVATLDFPALHTVVVSTYTCYRLAAFFKRFAVQVRTLVVRYEEFSQLTDVEVQAISQLQCLETLVISGRLMDNRNLGDDLDSASGSVSSSWFFDDLHDLHEASETTKWQLRKLRMVNCTPRWKPRADVAQLISISFEIEFTGHGKGWEDPRIALFMSARPTLVVRNVPL